MITASFGSGEAARPYSRHTHKPQQRYLLSVLKVTVIDDIIPVKKLQEVVLSCL